MDENESEDFQIQLHPLMLPPVLEVLFQKCDFDTLKLSRRVCKLWGNVSKTIFHKRCLLNFYNMYPETYINLIKSTERGHVYNPINVALTLSPLYEDSTSMRGLNVCPWHACNEFILPFGETIESLKFYAWDAVTEKLNASIFKEILLTPHYLKNLEISLLPNEVLVEPLFQHPWKYHSPLFYLKSLTMYGKMECSAEFLRNFLSAMPNINSIVVNCCSLDFLDLFTEALYNISLHNMHHLKLNFAGAILDTHIVNIKRANVNLKTLHVAPRSILTTFGEYNKLMYQLAPTLEDVKLTSCSNVQSSEERIIIPVMNKLKTLRLQTWRSGPAFWNLDFINNAPFLETLIIERRGVFIPSTTQLQQNRDLINQLTVKMHQNLKKLVLPSVPFQIPHPKTISTLLDKLPSLKNLTLSANDECLRCIYQHSPLLERLTIAEYSKITDYGITGLVNETLLPEGREMSYADANYNIELGITTLKELKRLEIDGFGGSITDFSIDFGIRHLKELKCVILHGCKVTRRSKKLLPQAQLTVVDHDALHVYDQEPL